MINSTDGANTNEHRAQIEEEYAARLARLAQKTIVESVSGASSLAMGSSPYLVLSDGLLGETCQACSVFLFYLSSVLVSIGTIY